MSEICDFDEIAPVSLTESVHVHQVLSLYLVRLPDVLQYVIPGRFLKLFLSHIGHYVLVLYLKVCLPSGSIIFLISKWCL